MIKSDAAGKSCLSSPVVLSNELLVVDESDSTNRERIATRDAIIIDYVCRDTCTRILECFLNILDVRIAVDENDGPSSSGRGEKE